MKNMNKAKMNIMSLSKEASLLCISFSPISMTKRRIIISNNSNINFVKNS